MDLAFCRALVRGLEMNSPKLLSLCLRCVFVQSKLIIGLSSRHDLMFFAFASNCVTYVTTYATISDVMI